MKHKPKTWLQATLTLTTLLQTTLTAFTESINKNCGLSGTPHISELNYFTYTTVLLGCANLLKIKDITPDASSTEYTLNLNDPILNLDPTNKITHISHQKKQDELLVAIDGFDAPGTTLLNSKVLFLPKYTENALNPFLALKIFVLSNKRIPLTGTTKPTVSALEAVPDNTYFVTADTAEQIFVWDRLTPNSIESEPEFIFESGYGKTVVNIKFRSLATQFMVGFREGTAYVHITNLFAAPPIILDHFGNTNAQLSAIEVFKYDERVMTGGSDGKILLWNLASQTIIKAFNDGGARGLEVVDLSWTISSNFFTSLHNDKKVVIWRMEGRFEHVESYALNSIPVAVATIGHFNSLFVATQDNILRLDVNSLRCHEFCFSCQGETEYDCESCFNGYTLQNTGYCQKDCSPLREFYNIETNDCGACIAGCRNCIGSRDIDCTNCETTYYQHPNRSCHTECQQSTYLSSNSYLSCKYCHPTCFSCSGGDNNDCSSCISGLFMNLDSTCTPSCKTGTFNQTETHCAICDGSCKECDGLTKNHCVQCHNQSIEFISENNECINCLDDYDLDAELCSVVHGVFLARTPYEADHLFSSLTLKIFIRNFSSVREMVQEKLDWGVPLYDVEVDGLTVDQFEKRETIRYRHFVIDLNFSVPLEQPKMITIRDSKRDAILANLTNKDIFMLQRIKTIKHKQLAPINLQLNKESALYVEKLARIVNIVLVAMGGSMVIAVFIMILYSYDLSYVLVDFTRMCKVLHRIKFINVNQTPLVEYFLSKIYNIYQSSLDYPRDEVDRYQVAFRGKLTKIGVPVFPLVNFSDKYLLYLVKFDFQAF